MNVGWALDFHEAAGNLKDFDVRLSSYNAFGTAGTAADGHLYINDARILTSETFADNQDYNTSTAGYDKYAKFDNNLRVIDYNDNVNYPDSASGCVNYELQIDPTGINVGSKLSQCKDKTAAWSNYADFDTTTYINELKLGAIAGDVTINGDQIWTAADSANIIYFIGQLPTAPNERSVGNPLQNGDQYYNISDNAYYYYNSATGAWTRLGQTGSIDTKQYFFRATDGQYSFECEHDPGYVSVSVSGVELYEDEYVSNNGISIVLNSSADLDEAVIVRTIFGSGAIQGGTRYNDIEEMVAVAKKIFPMVHNPDFVIVSVDGTASFTYASDGATIIMPSNVAVGEEFKATTVLEDEGRLSFTQKKATSTGGSQVIGGTFEPSWTFVFVDGSMLSNAGYTVSSTEVEVSNSNAGDEIQVYSMIDEINDGSMTFYAKEEIAGGAGTNSIDWTHNSLFTIVTVDGKILDSSAYSSNNDSSKIFFDTTFTGTEVIKAYSYLDTKS